MNGNDPVAHYELGRALLAQGRFDEAAPPLERAIKLNPDFFDAYNALALGFFNQGRIDPALGVLRRAIALGGNAESKFLFVQFLRSLRAVPDIEDLRDQMVRALSEPWSRPSVAAPVASDLIKNDPRVRPCIERATAAWPRRLPAQELLGHAGMAAISRHRLLAALLQSTPVADVTLERFFTALRFAMLEIASAASPSVADDDSLGVGCRLAWQCFLNEYVFSYSDEELDRARALSDRLASAIRSGAAVPELWLAAVASYFPLHTLPAAEALLDRPWSEGVAGVLTQQLREPDQERQLRASMPALTTIRDAVSREVREQYEQNPYPRWAKAEPLIKRLTIEQFLRSEFPLARFCNFGKGDDIDILIAGCGTGQQAIETAQRFPHARVLAIDLSLASLAYGKRKTRELGIGHIDYAQADILELASIGRSFDLIAVAGVLHHLADPFAGWRVLLSLLRPGGFMAVALYSELARANIEAARAFIAERGYRPTADDIRRCRQDLLACSEGTPQREVTRAFDFFTTSSCRDMLFHVQELRHTLPEIAEFLRDHDLEFIGFDVPAARKAYRARFPADPAMTDLTLWHSFECEHPDTFLGMYQFWVQKRTG